MHRLILLPSLCNLIGGSFPDMSTACPHQYYSNSGNYVNLTSSMFAENEIPSNTSHLFFYQNYNFLNSEKNIIFRLEPCRGVVYLYIRRTRPCWPDPWTDSWFQYKSVTDGSYDGTATLLEVPAESSQWFITVYAKTSARYALTIVPKSIDYPRIADGVIEAVQLARDTVRLSWKQAYAETPITNYIIYSSIYFDSGEFFTPSLILNSVCGLQLNTDHPYALSTCLDTTCKTNITGLSNNKRYVFNVVAHNKMTSLQSVYDGIIVRTVWDESNIDSIVEISQTAAIVIGTVTTVLVASYFFILYKY